LRLTVVGYVIIASTIQNHVDVRYVPSVVIVIVTLNQNERVRMLEINEIQSLGVKLFEANVYMYSAAGTYGMTGDVIAELETLKLIEDTGKTFLEAHYDLSQKYSLTELGKQVADKVVLSLKMDEIFRVAIKHEEYCRRTIKRLETSC